METVMRLYPPMPADEALEWLRREALARWGPELEPELESALKTLADAMAAVGATPLPDHIEP
jgi:hypothetical protein